MFMDSRWNASLETECTNFLNCMSLCPWWLFWFSPQGPLNTLFQTQAGTGVEPPTFYKLARYHSQIKESKVKLTAIKGKWFDVNDPNHLAMDAEIRMGHLPIINNLLNIKTACQRVNPYHAEFLKWNNQPYIFGTLSLSFLGIPRWKLKSWSANSIEPGQTARMSRLARLYTGGKGQSLSVSAGQGLIYRWRDSSVG